MKALFKYAFLAFSILLLFSCEKEMQNMVPVDISGVTITAAPFKFDTPQTKTLFDIGPSGAEFLWKATDVVGIYPDAGTQVKFPMTSGAGASTAKFDGGGWAVKGAYSYMAYYPFIADMNMEKNAIPANFHGQRQHGNNNHDHLGDFDYMAAVRSTPSGDGNVSFNFNHMGAIVRITLVVPKPGTYTSLTLRAPGASFTYRGTYDITQNNISITPTETGEEFTISLDDVTTSSVNETVVIYLMIPPVNLLSFTTYAIIRSATAEFSSILQPKNYEQGMIYAPTAETMTGDDIVKLANGSDFNSKLKSLANDYYYITDKTDYKIKHIVFRANSSYTPAPGDKYVDVSSDGSTMPIYAVWDEATETMTIHSSLSKIYTGQISDRMFFNMMELLDIDFSDVDTWYTESMGAMFHNCEKLNSLDLSGFNVSNVGEFGQMFENCSSITTLDLSNFVKSGPMGIDYMFQDCSSLETLDISGLAPKMTDCSSVFYGCSSLQSIDVSNWDTSECTYGNGMRSLFSNCSSLTSLDISNFDMSKVVNLMGMFSGCSSLTTLNLGEFATTSATNMGGLFSGCSSLTSINLGNICTDNVTDMGCMFQGCDKLTSLDLRRFNTSNATVMGAMFAHCSKLTTILGLSSFDTGNVTNMNGMFEGCSRLPNIDILNFDTSKCTTLRAMFSGCAAMTSIDLTSFNTPYVIDMEMMFNECDNLSTITFGPNFRTLYVETMKYMFSHSPSLTTLDLSFFDTSDVRTFERMFEGCTGLTNLNISSFSSEHKTNWYAMFNNCTSMENLNLGADFGADTDYWWCQGLGSDAVSCTVTCSPEAKDKFIQGYPGGSLAKFTFINATTGLPM